MSGRRRLASVGFGVLTGAALFATAGSAAADDTGRDTVLRIVTVEAEDRACPRHTGDTSGQDTRPGRAGQADLRSDAL